MFVLQQRPKELYALCSVAYSPDGTLLASGSDGFRFARGEVKLWDLATRRERATVIRRACGFHVVAFAPDGKTLAASSGDKTVRLWDVSAVLQGADSAGDKGVREKLRFKGPRSMTSMVFSPDGRALLTGSGDRSRTTADGSAQLWDASTGKLGVTLTERESVWAVAYSPDGDTVAVGNGEGQVTLYDPRTGKRQAVMRQDAGVRGMAFAPDGRTLATAKGWAVQLWDVAAQQVRAVLKGHEQMVWTAVFSPDGRLLTSGAANDVVRFWDAATGSPLGAFQWGVGSVHALAFAPDGMTAAAGGSHGKNSLVVWDVE